MFSIIHFITESFNFMFGVDSAFFHFVGPAVKSIVVIWMNFWKKMLIIVRKISKEWFSAIYSQLFSELTMIFQRLPWRFPGFIFSRGILDMQLISIATVHQIFDTGCARALYQLWYRFAANKQGYSLKKWLEGLSDEAYYPWQSGKKKSTKIGQRNIRQRRKESLDSSIKGNLRVFQNHRKQAKINVIFPCFPSLGINKQPWFKIFEIHHSFHETADWR